MSAKEMVSFTLANLLIICELSKKNKFGLKENGAAVDGEDATISDFADLP